MDSSSHNLWVIFYKNVKSTKIINRLIKYSVAGLVSPIIVRGANRVVYMNQTLVLLLVFILLTSRLQSIVGSVLMIMY